MSPEQIPADIKQRLRRLDLLDRITQISLVSDNLQDVLSSVLDLTLDVFNANRAWFLYPCDPAAPTWNVPLERTRPEWPGLFAQGVDMPMDSDISAIFSEALRTPGPIQSAPDTDRPVPTLIAEAFSVKSQIMIALRPKIGKAWLFGLHHCSRAVKHDENELLLFSAIAHRIADAITALITVRQLRESESSSRRLADSVINQAGVLVLMLDRDGRIVRFNQACEELSGYSFAEIEGKFPWDMLLPPEDAEDIRQNALDKLLLPSDAKSGKYTNYWLSKGGKRFLIEWHNTRLSDTRRNLEFMVSVGVDVTERKLAEEKAIKAQASLADAQRLAAIGSWEWNVLDDTALWSEETYRIFGIEHDELNQHRRYFLDMIFPEDRSKVNQALGDALSGAKKYDIEYRIRLDDGSSKVIHALAEVVRDGKGKPVLMRGTVQDITARKQAEEKLLITQFVSDQAPESILWIDEQGRIVYANEAACRERGYTREELLAKSIPDINPELPPVVWSAHWQKSRQQGHLAFESRHRRKNGSIFPIEISANFVKFGGREIVVAFVRDITERKSAEEQIKFLARIYAALSKTSQALIESRDEATLFDQICQIVSEFGGMGLAWIGVNDEQSGQIKPVASYGSQSDYLKEIFISSRADMAEGRGPAGTAFRERRPVYVQDFQTNPMLAPWSRQIAEYGWGSSGTVPIIRGGKPYGIMSFYHMDGHVFTKQVKDLLNEMAANIGFGLDRFDLETEKEKADESMRLAAAIFDSSAEAIMVTDADNLIVNINPAFTLDTGYTLEDLAGKNPRVLKSGRHIEAFYQAMWHSIDTDGYWQGEIWDKRKNGEIYPKWLTISVIRNSDGAVTHYVGSHSDISERKAAEEEIQLLAFYDPLTRLPNRRLLTDRLQHAIAASARSGHNGALLFIDLDHFKTLNDTLGHDIGDLLLQDVAKRLESCVREGDTVSRLGGDEFMLILEDLSEHAVEAGAQTEAVGEKILITLGQSYLLAGHECRSTPSIGATLFSGHQLPVEELMKQADIAMYQSKKAGRNTLRFFDPQMQSSINAHAALESELRLAIENRQFQLYYQVQVDSAQRVLGVEAVIRWIHPERGTVSPMEFIPLAEETGLILPIGRWVLETACAQLAFWQRDEWTSDLAIAVNISAKRFHQPGFVQEVQSVVKRHAIDPKLLKLELTESLLLENIEEAVATMGALNDIGVQLSLDDFGTGYSSLQYLKRLPLDQLKIDQSFVRDLASDISDKAIVKTIIAMAQSLGLDVIAEGVETAEQLRILTDMGCTHFQGYLFSKPIPLGKFEAALKQGVRL
ncbi:MAG: EAL domain-containing protein [Gallionella sp.]